MVLSTREVNLAQVIAFLAVVCLLLGLHRSTSEILSLVSGPGIAMTFGVAVCFILGIKRHVLFGALWGLVSFFLLGALIVHYITR